MLKFALTLLAAQAAPIASPPNIVAISPRGPELRDCVSPLARDTVYARVLVRCEVNSRGQPRDCRLQTGAELTARQQRAALCIAGLYRFNDANGQTATSGSVSIPVTLRVNVVPPPPGFVPPGSY